VNREGVAQPAARVPSFTRRHSMSCKASGATPTWRGARGDGDDDDDDGGGGGGAPPSYPCDAPFGSGHRSRQPFGSSRPQ